jgi:uncharacterized membrane protein YbhN (UPF0104 family)
MLMRLNKNIKIFINYFLAPLLLIWVSYSIYDQIQQQPRLGKSWRAIRNSFGSPLIWNLAAVFALMIVNWAIEAFKWKLSVRRVQPIGFFTAFKAVLSGNSVSVTTPNRVGEYLGRVLYMDEGNRLKAISLTIAGSMSQLLVTLVMGCAGLFIFRETLEANNVLPPIWMRAILLGSGLGAIALLVCYFRLPILIQWLEKLPWIRRFAWLLKELEYFNATLMLQLLSLSLLRFFVFIIQYYLLFRLYKVDVSLWEGFWTVSIAFLVMAIIPTIALITDLGLRGQVSMKLVSLFSSNYLGIGLTSVSIWFINLVIPALVGSLLIFSIKKIFKNTNDEMV